jgi:choline dehydrogenase-like flavoprotein
MTGTFDAIIIGSGAGGGAAAYALATKGQRVLVLEKGEVLPTDGSTLDAGVVLREGRFKNHDPWLDGNGATFVPQEYYNLGGKTKWYGAALLRYDPAEFEADVAHQCRGWPIRFSDLAPYYARAEGLLAVREFAIEPDTQRIVSALRRIDPDWHSQPLPLGLAAEIIDDPLEAVRFDGFASVRGLKSDAQSRFLDQAVATGNVTIVTGAPARALVADGETPVRVAGVDCEDGSRHLSRVVLLACGALGSPPLLQRYFAATGLDRSLPTARSVGRNYKSHLLTAVVGFGHRRLVDRLRKTVVLTHPRFPHSSVQPLGATDGEILATELPAFLPRWLIDPFGARAYGFFLQTEDGSSPDNRVIAAVNGMDKPRLDYRLDRIAPARDEHAGFVRAFRRNLMRAGFLAAVKPIPLAGTAHACGTLVAGDDPADSVVDGDGRVHGLDNLYVVDGSVLPRSSRVNPALTIYAWSLRVVDRVCLEQGGSR